MPSDLVEIALYRWAIPEAFNGEIAVRLLPEQGADEASKLWASFEEDVNQGSFRYVRRTGPDRYVFTPEARQAFLQYWRTEEHREEFQQLNRILYEYFQARLEEKVRRQSPAPLLLSLLRQSLSHLIAADETAGLQEFEKWFSHYEQAGRALVCRELIGALDQQITDLSLRGQLWVTLYRARLAALHERAGIAEGTAIETGSSQAMLKALLQNYQRLRETEAFTEPLLEGWIWNLLGVSAFQRREHEAAVRSFQEAVRALNEGVLTQEAIAISVNLGMALREAGQLEAARQACQLALERAQTSGVAPAHIQATLWLELGMIYGDLALRADQPASKTELERKARDHFTRAVLAYASLGDKHREGLALALCGRWLMVNAQIEEAIAYLEKALEILKSVDAPEAETVQEWLEICKRVQSQEETLESFLLESPEHAPLLTRFLQFFGKETGYLHHVQQDVGLLYGDYRLIWEDVSREDIDKLLSVNLFPRRFYDRSHRPHTMESLTLLDLGMQAYREGRLNIAIRWFQEAVEQARYELRPDVELSAMDWLSLSWMMTGSREAVACTTEFLSRVRRLKYESYEITAQIRFAETIASRDLRNKWKEVRPLLEKGVKVARQQGDVFWEAYYLIRLGQFWTLLDNLANADKNLRRALSLIEQIKTHERKWLESELWMRLAEVSLRQQETDRALRYAEKAAAIAGEYGEGWEARTRIIQAQVLRLRGMDEESLAIVEKALPSIRSYGWRSAEAEALYLKGLLLSESGRRKEAETSIRQALQVAQEIGFKEKEIEYMIGLAQTVLAVDQGKATRILNEVRRLSRQQGYTEYFKIADELLHGG